MSARDALVERAKKASEASRHQVHAYVGANDYLYEQARSIDLPARFNKLKEEGVSPLRKVLEQYAPNTIRETLAQSVESVKGHQDEWAERGEIIVGNWREALAVKDATSLIKTVREAENVSEAAKSVKTWFAEFPPDEAPVSKPAASKPAARKTPAKKAVRKAAKPAVTKPAV